jgi:hypothetical protein
MRKEYPSQDRLKELFDYKKDGFLVRKINVAQTKTGDIAGSANSNGYIETQVDRIRCLMHRIIWIYHNGYNAENQIDHINRNRSDNRIENLREVTQTCNNRNTGNHVTNKSGVKGVHWSSHKGKWHVQISINNRVKYIGRWSDFNEAVLARLSVEQCLDWEGCDSSSPAYQYAIRHKLIKR